MYVNRRSSCALAWSIHSGRMRGVALGLLLVACSVGAPPPPTTFSIDSAFSPEQSAVLRDGMTAWCDSVGWCPEEVTYSERGRFILATDYVHDTDDDTSSAYNDNNTNIYVDAGSSSATNLHTLWLVATHEAGHWGIEGHPVEPPALMAAEVHSKSPLVIDNASRSAWCAEQGCRSVQP